MERRPPHQLEVGRAMNPPVHHDRASHPVEVRVLGGLSVVVCGESVALPAGAVSVAMAMLALRRAVHVEELTDVLWPEAPPEVARRRLRNVLARLKHVAGPIVVRQGERVELAAGVAVDHHVLESRARQVLSAPPGPERDAQLQAVLDEASEPFLPEVLYEDWAEPARRQAEARRQQLHRALEEGRVDR